jgi:hypothetical protein
MLGLLVALSFQDPPTVVPGQEAGSALRIQLSGRIDAHYFYRNGVANEAGGILNGLPPEVSSTNAWAGRASLRADVWLKDSVSGVLELENRSFDEGANRPFSSEPETDDLDLKQAYIGVGEFLSPTLSLRIGVQGLSWRNRPHGEPFFLDLGESEGFFEGFSAAGGGQIRNTVDRDVREAAGLRLVWTPFDVLTVQTIALVYGEGGSASDDEALYGLAASARLADAGAAWLLLVLASGGDPGLDQIWTLGAGADWYFGEERELELFVEGYLQRGKLAHEPRDLQKEAFAAQAGSRLVLGKVWLEAAGAFRSGNRRLSDSVDEAFQSYENENRFLILESAEFGLDVDTNVRVARGALGVGPFDLAGRPLRIQADLGRFEAVAPLRDGAGAALAQGEDDWGIEGDLALTWSYNESLQFRLQAAWLAGSDLLEELSADRKDETRLLVAGADLRF